MKLTIWFEPDLREVTTARVQREDGGLAWTANFSAGVGASEGLELPAVAMALAALAGLWGHSWALAAGVAVAGVAVAVAGRIWVSGTGRKVTVVSADGSATFEVVPDGWRENAFVVRERGNEVARISAAPGAWTVEGADGKALLVGASTAPSVFASSWESLPGAPKFTFAEAPLKLSGAQGAVTLVSIDAARADVEIDFDVAPSIGLAAALAGVVKLREALA